MKNFKVLVQKSDVSGLIAEISKNYHLFNMHNFRTTHKNGFPFGQCSDIILNYNDLNVPNIDWLETVPYPAMYLMPNCKRAAEALMFAVGGHRLGRVMITLLPAHAKIAAHEDDPALCRYYTRHHIAIMDNPHTTFRCGDEVFTPNQGDIFSFNNALEHEVINAGDTDRITMIVDIRKPTVLKFYGKDESPVQPIEPKIIVRPEGINYQRESFADIMPELIDMTPLHYQEIARNQDVIPLDPNWEQYLRLEQADILHVYTVRDGQKLVGYHIALIGGHLHYKSTKHAMTDIYFILKEYRNNGIGFEFFKRVEGDLKSLDVVKIATACKLHQNHTQLFLALGYTHSDNMFAKIIG
jgi:Aspartyl/Asparaginyl beta-hydroxylase/Acetyltransferase (GNAT) family